MADFDFGMRPLLEALDEPTLVIGAGVVLAANTPARRLFGARIEGNDLRLAIRHPQVLERLLAGEAGEIDVSGIGGFERPWTLLVRNLSGRALLVRFVDRAALAAAERMRVDFVANASHELRTPLATIMGYAETLADEADLESGLRTRFAGTIRSEAQRMLGLIEDLMNLSRIAADRFDAPQNVVDPGAVTTRVAERIAAQGCTIDIDIADALPPVRADDAQLAQLIDNLLTNALRYGCRTQSDRIRVNLAPDGDFVRLSVSDNGPGIAAEHLPRLTERFYRIDAARSRASGGTGLGLAIVKHIVERHKGTLDIRSTVGSGTEVVVRLPVAR